ncbi:M4 family metallopeptidase [Runella sp.]|uniref:M4 family metallopeptidase n=1 Tax=Runella sp. TaxID=1960881 RepID=UPI003D0A632D
MKKQLLSIILILELSCIPTIAQKYQPKYLKDKDESFNRLILNATENGWIEFKKEAKINPNTFFKVYGKNLGLDQQYDFKLLKEETDKKQNRHQRYQLYYKNIPLEGVEFTLHSSIEGVLTLAHGRIPDGLEFDVSKPIPESKAFDLALASMKLSLADFEKKEKNARKGELLFTKLSEEAIAANFRLAYAFKIYGNEPLNAFQVYVDANTGEIIKKVPLIHSNFDQQDRSDNSISTQESSPQIKIPNTITAPLVASTFIPNYARYLNGQGNITFETEVNPVDNTQFRLSAFNGALITRRVVNGNTDWNTLPDVTNNSSNWQANVQSRDAQTAHWLIQRMYQYMSQAPDVNRDGINGNLFRYPRVLTGRPIFNAFWNLNDAIEFGRDDTNNNNSMVMIDVLGHEYMHAVTQFTANLAYVADESGALNEAISDIFGTALERNVLPNDWNWLCGEDLGPNRHFRNMAAPGSVPNEGNLGRYTQPEVYWGANWYTGNNASLYVHINSGVLNKWFHAICTGQSVNSNIQLHPIDFDKGIAIVYKALTVYLQSSSRYSDMANATIQAARDLYGNCSIEEETVQNAWSAANIGGLFFRSCGGTGGLANGCYNIKAKHSNKILQPENGNNGARIRQYDANATVDQIVEISAADNESYFIQSKATGKAYEIPNTSSGDIPVQASDFTFDNRQKWLLVRRTDGSYLMLPKLLPSHAVDVEGVSQNNGAGTMVWGGGIHDGDNQHFFIQSTGCEVAPPSCNNTGSITYQRWDNIGSGTSIQDLRNNTNNLNNSPSSTQTLSLFEAPENIADNYGVRIRGYVCPPTTGNYTFWIAGDDNVELWISPNDQPTNLSRIAYHTAWTPGKEWGWFSTQQSNQIFLQAGQRRYVEALMKEGGGGDNLSVGWQLPNGALERPIPSNRIIPYSGGGCTPPDAPTLTASINPINSGQSSTLTASNCSGTVNWSTGATGSSVSVSPSQSTTYTATCTVNGCTGSNGSITLNVNINNGCGSGTGLTANYYGNHDLTGNPIATLTQGPIDIAGNESQTISGTGVAGLNVSARWEGQVEAPVSGSYTFNIRTDDGVRAWFDNNQVVNDYGYYPPTDHNFTVTLNQGQKYNIKIEWKQGNGGYEAKLFWAYPGQSSQIVPVCRLYPTGGGCNAPGAPTLTASINPINSGQSSTLTASNCSGTVNWSTGATGSSISVSPSQSTTYTATCTVNGCTGSNGSVTLNVNGSGGSLNQCLESESSTGDGVITGDPNASNGSTRGHETNNNAHYVDYVVTGVPSAGTYYAKLRYYSATAPVVNVSVNGGSTTTINLANSGSWNIVWTEQTFQVNLTSGTNTIRVQGAGGGNCRQDRLCVSNNPPRIGVVGSKEAISLESTEDSMLQLYPNPTDGMVTVKYQLAKGKKASLQFINMSGQVLVQKALLGEGGWQQDQTDLSSQPEGTYSVRLESDKQVFTRKFSIIK